MGRPNENRTNRLERLHKFNADFKKAYKEYKKSHNEATVLKTIQDEYLLLGPTTPCSSGPDPEDSPRKSVKSTPNEDCKLNFHNDSRYIILFIIIFLFVIIEEISIFLKNHYRCHNPSTVEKCTKPKSCDHHSFRETSNFYVERRPSDDKEE